MPTARTVPSDGGVDSSLEKLAVTLSGRGSEMVEDELELGDTDMVPRTKTKDWRALAT